MGGGILLIAKNKSQRYRHYPLRYAVCRNRTENHHSQMLGWRDNVIYEQATLHSGVVPLSALLLVDCLCRFSPSWSWRINLGTWRREGGRQLVMMMGNDGSRDDESGVQEAESSFPDFKKVPTHQIVLSLVQMLHTV